MVHCGSAWFKNQAFGCFKGEGRLGMWDFSIQLVAIDGAGWEFSYTFADVFFVLLTSGGISFSAVYVAHRLATSREQFKVYFTNVCITLPVSELDKFESFLLGARAARLVQS